MTEICLPDPSLSPCGKCRLCKSIGDEGYDVLAKAYVDLHGDRAKWIEALRECNARAFRLEIRLDEVRAELGRARANNVQNMLDMRNRIDWAERRISQLEDARQILSMFVEGTVRGLVDDDGAPVESIVMDEDGVENELSSARSCLMHAKKATASTEDEAACHKSKEKGEK